MVWKSLPQSLSLWCSEWMSLKLQRTPERTFLISNDPPGVTLFSTISNNNQQLFLLLQSSSSSPKKQPAPTQHNYCLLSFFLTTFFSITTIVTSLCFLVQFLSFWAKRGCFLSQFLDVFFSEKVLGLAPASIFLDSPGRLVGPSSDLDFPRTINCYCLTLPLHQMALIIKLNRKDGITNKGNIW